MSDRNELDEARKLFYSTPENENVASVGARPVEDSYYASTSDDARALFFPTAEPEPFVEDTRSDIAGGFAST